MDTSRSIRRTLLACAIALLIGSSTSATDLRDVITDVTITSWNEKDGLPSALIGALAQSRDGYLWIGTRQGLFRFDGVRFVPWDNIGQQPLPDNWIRSLLAAKDGSLWVGLTDEGQVARIAGRHVQIYKGDGGLGRGPVMSMAEDAAGTVWAAGEAGLFSFDGTRWTHWSTSHGIPEGPVTTVFGDRDGSLYAAMNAGVFVRRQHADRFERATGFADTLGSFAQTADGAVWMTDPTVGYRRLSDTHSSGLPLLQGRGLRMVVDRKNNLWIGTGGQGLWRLRAPGAAKTTLERSISLTGLLGDGIYSLIEDRSGNIWAGTTEGLNRLTPRTFEQVIDLGLVRGLQLDAEGRVWIGTVNKVVTHLDGQDSPRVEVPLAAEARAMTADRHGIWVVAGDGVYRVDRDGRSTRLMLPAQSVGGSVDAIAADHRGGLWLVAGPRVLHWDGAEVTAIVLPDAAADAKVSAVLVSASGDAWFAFGNGSVVVAEGGGKVRLVANGHEGRPVYRAIAEDDSGAIWLAGDGGLTVYQGERDSTLRRSERFRVDAITALVIDDRGGLWLATSQGLVHLPRDEFERAIADDRVVPRYALHTRSDGVAGSPLAVGFNRGAVRTADGRLWFVTTRGLTIVDPHVFGGSSAPAPVQFEAALADDRQFAPGAPLELPAGTRRLEIAYTAVNLTTPLKAKFRYRLEPFESEWVDAGSRRQAFYTNLKPGQYTFHVVATDAGGAAASNEASWKIAVAPMFYQTTAFYVLSTAGLGLVLYGGWRYRERQLRKQFSLIITERARLGREIHDTLLQGLVAVALQFDSLAHELASIPNLQERFVRLRDRIEEYIREARRSIWDLHTQPRHRTLVDSLKRAGEFATDGCGIAFTFKVQGTPYQCPPQLEEQAVRIAQEAALNAVRHAAPQRLRIDLSFEETALRLTIADDGRGFRVEDAQSNGHYGISSMHERAKTVGGTLTLTSSPGQGTEVTAVLPLAS